MTINFIQLGANVGNSYSDVLWLIVRERGWNGIFVEPMPGAFEKLKQNYADLTDSYFENLAIMDYTGEVIIKYNPSDITKEAPYQQASVADGWAPNTASLNIPCITLDDLVDKYNMRDVEFDMLQIDCEKYDGKILMATDFTNILPKIIRYEKVHIDPRPVNEHLARFNYVVKKDPYNDLCPGEDNFDEYLERMN